MSAPLPLAERIHQACPCRLKSALAIINCHPTHFCECRAMAAKTTGPLQPCSWEGHAIAGEVNVGAQRAAEALNLQAARIAALTAKVEASHNKWCRCHDAMDCIQNILEIGCTGEHPHIDPRCVKWRRK